MNIFYNTVEYLNITYFSDINQNKKQMGFSQMAFKKKKNGHYTCTSAHNMLQ